MRFLTCGADGVLVELADLDETLRVFTALQDTMQQSHQQPSSDVVSMSDSAESDNEHSQASRHTGGGHASAAFRAIRQLIPAAHTLYVSFDPLLISWNALVDAICALDFGKQVAQRSQTIEISVIYDGEDLHDIADLLGLSVQETIRRHCDSAWSVAFVGFAPGFAYLTGGDPVFNVPRRKVPRLSVPAGAVGLAGTFSGVYPRVSSGGWQLLGHTEIPMWNDAATPPALLQPGDAVKFIPARAQNRANVSDSAESDNQGTKYVSQLSVSGESDEQTAKSNPRMSVSPESDTFDARVALHSARLEVLRPGLLTTFQDDGRTAANMGVTGSGAADSESFHLANMLVGNPANTPALEITGGGVRMLTHGNIVVSITGAPVEISIFANPRSQEQTMVTMQEATLLRDGEMLEIGVPRSGLRNYVSVRGGFDVAKTLDSAATDTMSGIGPRPIVAKQQLAVCNVRHTCDCGVGLPVPWPSGLPRVGEITELDVRLGPRDDWFTQPGVEMLLAQIWTVTAQSNRVGLRLAGEIPLERYDDRELASEATPPGAIEVPTSGQPVVFLRDQPVTGGYPVVAVLEPRSLDLAGQLPPGARIRFRVSSACAPHLSDSADSDIQTAKSAPWLSVSGESDNQTAKYAFQLSDSAESVIQTTVSTA